MWKIKFYTHTQLQKKSILRILIFIYLDVRGETDDPDLNSTKGWTRFENMIYFYLWFHSVPPEKYLSIRQHALSFKSIEICLSSVILTFDVIRSGYYERQQKKSGLSTQRTNFYPRSLVNLLPKTNFPSGQYGEERGTNHFLWSLHHYPLRFTEMLSCPYNNSMSRRPLYFHESREQLVMKLTVEPDKELSLIVPHSVSPPFLRSPYPTPTLPLVWLD
jgi:hypothetical protein